MLVDLHHAHPQRVDLGLQQQVGKVQLLSGKRQQLDDFLKISESLIKEDVHFRDPKFTSS